jgi:hypothetical protein
LKALRQAFNVRAYIDTDRRPLPVACQAVEACEWLCADTGEAAYRELVLAWARSHQRVRPMHPWAYAVEAKYASDPQAYRRGLGIALYLDARSVRIEHLTEAERQEARRWFGEHDPFSTPPRAPGKAA